MDEAATRILIIEDDRDIATFEEMMLRRAGYQTQIAETGAAGLRMVVEFKPEVVLLDIGLPDMSGLEVCETIAATADAFILLVSGQASEQYKLNGLGLGADDYITKPFSGNELVARVGSFLRRRDRARLRSMNGRLPVGDAELIRDHQILQRGTEKTSLTALEFKLLWFLAEGEGTLLTRAQILEHVWNDVSGVPTRVVDVHVAALRKKLSDVGVTATIASVRGIGYRLDIP
ncbi:MAG TPA: response regulator transcription factor [Candidatus Baltobacteraceae bacterium]|jgi:DNA-binding response OmpR family regulator|nr:response regulator transcription factor [Candidatus Baltobacteraceae bacterium]